jgi:type VI secretion system protein ImpF
MARTELDRAVLPSLLDRLTDEAPREPADPPTSREESARRFRQSVQRDLDWLLNTRRTIVAVTADLPEVANSVHQYGLPDFTGMTTSHADWRERLVEDVRETIRLFEPRLANVVVQMVDADSPHAHQVRFSVSATLLMDPSPEQVVFDTVLEVSSGTYEVQDKT